MDPNQPRQPAGSPAGGQFGTKAGSAPQIDLDLDAADHAFPASPAQSAAAARIASVLPLLGMDLDDPEAAATDLIANALHWAWVNSDPSRRDAYLPDELMWHARNHFDAETEGDDLSDDPLYAESERDAVAVAGMVAEMQTMRSDVAKALAMLDEAGSSSGWTVAGVAFRDEAGAAATELTVDAADGMQVTLVYIPGHGFEATVVEDDLDEYAAGSEIEIEVADETRSAYHAVNNLTQRYGKLGLSHLERLIDGRRSNGSSRVS